MMEPEEMEPGGGRGWQHAAASKVEHHHREELFVHMRPSHRAQVGPGAGMALSSAPVNFLTRIPPHLFRVVLLRRPPTPFASIVAHMPVWPPNPTSLATTEHRAHEPGCWGEGGSHWKARQPESAGKLEAESQPTSWSVIWTLPEPRSADGRRLEVVVDGLPLFGGCQLAVDTTVVVRSSHRGAENLDGGVGESSSQEGTNIPRTGGAQKKSPVLWFLALRLEEAACPWRLTFIPEPVGQGSFQAKKLHS